MNINELRYMISDIRDLVEMYGDERSCVTYNGWFKYKKPADILTIINSKLDVLDNLFQSKQ